MQETIDEVYNFSLELLTLQGFKDEVTRNFTPSQIQSLIHVLTGYVQVRSTYEMHQRVYGDKTDELFEAKMKGIKKLQDDLAIFLKKVDK